jgi:aminoglycoside phosphotransferase (APT) family kinase protein
VAEAAALRMAYADRPTESAIDAARLDAYLRAHITGLSGDIEIAQAAGGMSNPTFFVSYGDRRMVLRKQPGVTLSPSAHRIDREYRVLRALDGSAIPVPSPILYCEDAGIVGTPFYMMARLEGRLFPDSSLPGISRDQRHASYAAMCATMAAMHQFDWAGAGLGDFGKPGNYFGRQLAGWVRQWEQFGISDNPDVDALIRYLREHLPASDTAAICHGDYRVANVMFDIEESRVSGVFDWELSTIGHPLADVAFNLQAWFLTPEQNGGILGLDLDALGIPSARDYVDLYYAQTPNSERLTAFHIAFAMFRAAVGLSGVALRNEAGDTNDMAAGRKARAFAIAYAKAGTSAIDSWDRS